MKLFLTALILLSLSARGQDTFFIGYSPQGKQISIPFPQCQHIYVAVMPDTVVWDKKPVKYHEYQIPASSTLDSIPASWTSLNSWVASKPQIQQIVCILCHKQTEQAIKIINEQK